MKGDPGSTERFILKAVIQRWTLKDISQPYLECTEMTVYPDGRAKCTNGNTNHNAKLNEEQMTELKQIILKMSAEPEMTQTDNENWQLYWCQTDNELIQMYSGSGKSRTLSKIRELLDA